MQVIPTSIMRMECIDVSSYQDPAAYWLDGVSLLMVKVSEGIGYRNPNCDEWTRLGLLHSIPVGFYHFLYSGSIDGQVDYFLGSLPAGDHTGSLAALDVEFTGDGRTWFERGRDIVRWAERMRSAGLRPLVYLSRSWALALRDAFPSVVDVPLWVADYTGSGGAYSGRLPEQWSPVMHQYTSTPIDRSLVLDDSIVDNIDDMNLDDTLVNSHGETVSLRTILTIVDERLEKLAHVTYESGIDRPYKDLEGSDMPTTDVVNATRWDAKHYFEMLENFKALTARVDRLSKLVGDSGKDTECQCDR